MTVLVACHVSQTICRYQILVYSVEQRRKTPLLHYLLYIVSMADNYLEKHREEYELRKQAWLRSKKKFPKVTKKLQRPEDEAL